MSGRRSYPRFNIMPSPEGVLSVVRDVTVQRADRDEFLVIGRAAGVVGEVLTIELADGTERSGARVQVVDSVPVIVDGSVRHRLRLRRVPEVPGMPGRDDEQESRQRASYPGGSR